MNRVANVQRVFDRGLVAIIRAPSGESLTSVARALLEGGIDVLEVTFTVPGAVRILEDVRRELGDAVLLGAGTVLDSETARAAILAGAEFIVSPIVNTEVIETCNRYSAAVMPGAFTPTEVMTAWDAGADVVKIFPADVGGPNYLKALHGPLPQVKLMPTGGVNLDTMESFFNAGACAVGLGSALVRRQDIEAGDMDAIRANAAAFVDKLNAIRND